MKQTLIRLSVAGLAALSVAACQTPAAQQIRSDIRTLPDVFRTGVTDAKGAIDALTPGTPPAQAP